MNLTRLENLVLNLTVTLVFGLALAADFSFTEKGTMPNGRSHMSNVVIGSKIYLFGGRQDPMLGSGSTDVVSYDAATNTWTTLADTTKRYGTCAATDGERIWVFG